MSKGTCETGALQTAECDQCGKTIRNCECGQRCLFCKLMIEECNCQATGHSKGGKDISDLCKKVGRQNLAHVVISNLVDWEPEVAIGIAGVLDSKISDRQSTRSDAPCIPVIDEPDRPGASEVSSANVIDTGLENGAAMHSTVPPSVPTSPLQTINGKPALRLPSDGRPIGDFAGELGLMLAEKNIFARKGLAFTLDAEGHKLEPATPTWLRSWVEEHVVCYKVRGANGQEIQLAATMTEDVAKVVLQAPQFLEQLLRVERFHPCRMPIVRRDGRLELLPEGHDLDSATYTVPGSAYPLDMSVDEACEVIGQAIAEFPFAEDSGRSRAVAVAALLTVYAGGLMPEGATRPVFLYLANAEGAGKTTVAQVAGIPYGAVAAQAAPTSEEEWQKQLLSAVIGGRRLLLLDNVKGFLSSPSLEAYTTASSYTGRILGTSKEFSGEACATILITGNGLIISPDMRRRSLIVELFMHELRAEDRCFARRLDAPALIELRPRLLAACWALVRAWNDAGRPASSRMNSSFPRWCDTIAGIVEHAGYACPTAPAEIDGMGDTDTRDIGRLANELVIGTRYSFSELAELCAGHGLFERFTTDMDFEGGLSRKAKAAFPRVLRKYDQRTIAPRLKFFVEGEGHSRRYFVTNPV